MSWALINGRHPTELAVTEFRRIAATASIFRGMSLRRFSGVFIVCMCLGVRDREAN